MGFDLQKGSSFDLSKEAPSMSTGGVGLGWKTEADLDVSAFCVGEDGHINEMTDFVYYNSSNTTVLDGEDGPRPYTNCGGIYGAIDVEEGDEEEDGDDEDMWVYFDRISENIKEIIVVVTIHDEGVTFSDVSGCYCRIWDADTDKELCRYVMSDDFSNEDAVEIGKFSRVGDGWQFTAIGKGHVGGLQALIQKFAYKF